MATRTNLITGETVEKRGKIVTLVNGTRTERYYTEAEEQALDQQAEDSRIIREAALAKETERLAKKLKKSELRALKQLNTDASSIAELKAVNVEMIRLFENVLAFQSVEVEEDE